MERSIYIDQFNVSGICLTDLGDSDVMFGGDGESSHVRVNLDRLQQARHCLLRVGLPDNNN